MELVKELKNKVGAMYLVLNKVDGELPLPLRKAIGGLGLDVLGVDRDPQVAEFDALGRPLVELPRESSTYRTIGSIAARIGLRPGVHAS